MWKKSLIIFMLIFALGLVACTESGESEATKEPEPTAKVNSFKVGIIIPENESKDSDFVQLAISGLNNFEKKTGCEVVTEKVVDESQVKDAAKVLVEKECDLIWAVGVTYGNELLGVAKSYPDTNFAVVDGQYEDAPDNVTGVGFRSNEASFLAGYVAAYKSKTGKIGFIGGMQGDVIDGFRVGFEAGARYYNEDIVVIAEWSDSFTDKEKARDIAKGMFAKGCDVVFPAAGAAGQGAIEEAKSQNKYAVGVDRDQSYLGEEVIITSVLKMADSAVEYVCLRAKEGIDIGGQNLNYGLSDGAVGISEYSNDHIPLGEQNKLDNLKEMIVSDRLVVPKTQEDLDSFKPVRE